MKKIIVAGKGGAGKTTLSAALIHRITQVEPDAKLLVIDADPAATLAASLGITSQPQQAIGELRVFVEDSSENEEDLLARKLREECIVQEYINGVQVDFGYMGHHKENSCLCSYNHSLGMALRGLLRTDDSYDYVLIDREAGLEHISRSVYGSEDDSLVMVAWPSPDYLSVVKEILDLADALGTTANRFLVLNDILGLNLDDSQVSELLRAHTIPDITTFVLPRLSLNVGTEKHKVGDILDENNIIAILDNLLHALQAEYVTETK